MFLLITLMGACRVSKDVKDKKYNNESLYRQSVTQAMSPDSSKISYDLIAINHQNEKLEWKNFNGKEYLLLVA